MNRFAWILVIAIAMIAPVSAHGVWIAPQRPMSEKERLAYEVSDADVIGLGHLLAVHDTVVDIAPDGSGLPSRAVALRVEEWLKGAGPSTMLAGVSLLSEAPFPWNAVSGTGAANTPLEGPLVVFMLRETANGWGILDGPLGSGIRIAPRGSQDSLCAAIRLCVSGQRPDTLLRKADLVFVGRVIGTRPCYSESLTCSDVVVDQVLGGRLKVGQTVSVFTPLWDLIEQRMLYVLRMESEGVYERLGQLSGSQRLEDGVADRWRIHVEEVRHRYRLLHGRSDDRLAPGGR